MHNMTRKESRVRPRATSLGSLSLAGVKLLRQQTISAISPVSSAGKDALFFFPLASSPRAFGFACTPRPALPHPPTIPAFVFHFLPFTRLR